mgnify:CR=1 FL=1
MTVPYPAPVEAQMQRYYPSLSEKDRRRYAAIEAVKMALACVTEALAPLKDRS